MIADRRRAEHPDGGGDPRAAGARCGARSTRCCRWSPTVAALAARTRQVLFIARGSSDAAALYGRYLCEVGAGRLATPASPSVATRYRRRLDLDGVLAVALSQSGQTEEIVQTLAWAADCGATTVAVTNDADSPLAAAAELALVTQAGPERAVPATKSYTTQLAALVVLALGLGADPDLRGSCARVPDAVAAIATESDVDPLAVTALSDVHGLVVSGRGFAASTAWELSLKVRETCCDRREWTVLCGPPARPDRRRRTREPRRCWSPRTTARSCAGVLAAGRAGCGRRRAGAPVGGGPALAAVADVALPGPDLPEQLAPLGLVVPGQLAVEALARRLGLDPDAPGGLKKVTQTDEEPA